VTVFCVIKCERPSVKIQVWASYTS